MKRRAVTSGSARALQLLVVTAAACLCAGDHRTVLVTDSAGLAASLRDSSVDNIAVKGTVTVDPRDFRTAALVAERRAVAIKSASKLPAERGTIDFGGTADVAHVAAFGVLAADSLQIKGLAPPDVRTGLPLHAASIALWPSVRGDPDSTFEMTETCVAFPLPEGPDSCAAYCSDVAAALGSGVSVGGSNDTLLVDGQTVLRLPIVAFGATAGHFTLKVANSTLVCQDEIAAAPDFDAAAAGTNSWGTWFANHLTARFLLMLGPQAALLATVLVMTMAWWTARTKRKECEAEREQSADTLTDAAIDAAMSADKRNPSGWGQSPLHEAAVRR